MSKLDVGVGDEFPLDEGDPGDHRAWKQDYRAHRRALREHRHRHHHHRHHHFHFAAHLALLAVIGGFAALIVAGKLPIAVAYGLIALGAVAILALVFFRVRHFHRRQAQ